MRKYIEHVQKKSPHERRTHALFIAGSITAVLFVGWLAVLGSLSISTGNEVAREVDISQTAAALFGAAVPDSGFTVLSEPYGGY